MVILKTKILLPVYDDRLLERSRLIEKLQQSIDKKLILISGAAGSGKTSLVNVWQHREKGAGIHRFAWYTVDAQDNEPSLFIAYLVAAFREAGCFQDRNIPGWAPQTTDISIRESFSHILNMLIDENSTDHLFLVVDDYHHILCPEIHEGMDFFIRYLPGNVHIFILSRIDPPLNLAALRASDQILDIRSEELNFSFDESTLFLKSNVKTEIDNDGIAKLFRETEGWAAGLRMAALCSQNLGSIEYNWYNSKTFAIEYLMEEVFSQQPREIRDFLLITSLLDRFTADLCRAVTGNTQSTGIITSLERDNLFLVRLDQDGEWFRYHHLFSELLKKRLHMEYSQEIPKFHEAASSWLLSNNFLQEAFDHGVLSQNPSLLGPLACVYAQELWAAGEHTFLLKRLIKIPEPVLSEHPSLQLYIAWLNLAEGKIPDAMKCIHTLENSTLTRQETGMFETVKAFHANLLLKADQVMEHASKAIALFGDENPVWRSSAAVILGHTHAHSGDLDNTEKAFRSVFYESTTSAKGFCSLLASFHLALVLEQRGKLEEAKAFCHKQLVELENNAYPQVSLTGGLYALLGGIACQRNELSDAIRYGSKGVELCEQGSNFSLRCYAYLNLAVTYIAALEHESAEKMIARLADLQENPIFQAWLEGLADSLKVALLSSSGKYKQALQLLKPDEILNWNVISDIKIMQALQAGRLLVITGRYEAGIQILNKLKEQLYRQNHLDAYLHCLLSHVIYNELKGFPEKAESILMEALDSGSTGLISRPFIDASPSLMPVFRRLFAKNLLDAFGLQVFQTIHTDSVNTSPVYNKAILLDKLSTREVEILEFLPSGLSYPEIADQLYISYSTLRSHCKNIYSKLDAHSRIEAVYITRKTGLL